MENYDYKPKKKDDIEPEYKEIKKEPIYEKKPEKKKFLLELKSGDNVVNVNGNAVTIDPSPFFNRGVHWLPVEPLMEFLKGYFDVSFDEKTYVLKIGGK